MDYVYLQGAGDVERAGHQISRAAQEMQQAASNIDASLTNHQRFMDDWLDRFAVVMEKFPIAMRVEPVVAPCMTCGKQPAALTATGTAAEVSA